MIHYTHLMEFLPGRVAFMSGFMIFLDGMVLVISPITILLITKNLEFFLWVGLMMNILPLMGFIFMYIPESIKFQLDQGRYDSAEKDI